LAPSEWPATQPASEELKGAAARHRFELDAWPIGESIRRAFICIPS